MIKANKEKNTRSLHRDVVTSLLKDESGLYINLATSEGDLLRKKLVLRFVHLSIQVIL